VLGINRCTQAPSPDFETLKHASDDELRAAYCEAMVATFEASGFKMDPPGGSTPAAKVA
jgi:hypothetical protein